MNKYIYKQIEPIDQNRAEEIFATNDIEAICNAMVSVAFHEKNWKWAQDKFISFFYNENPELSSLAATCLGHIARIHGKLEKEKVVKILRSRLNDKNICGFIEDALEDIEIFVRPI